MKIISNWVKWLNKRIMLTAYSNEYVKMAFKECSKELCIEFGTWLRDNYSPNVKQGSDKPLPKNKVRKDFTNEHYTIEEVVNEFLKTR